MGVKSSFSSAVLSKRCGQLSKALNQTAKKAKTYSEQLLFITLKEHATAINVFLDNNGHCCANHATSSLAVATWPILVSNIYLLFVLDTKT